MSENSELFRKLEPSAQFWCERTSSTNQPSQSTRGSVAHTTTSSLYSSFRDRERSLDPGRLQRVLQHSRTNGASLFSLRRALALRSDLRWWKGSLAFRLYTASVDKDRPKKASLSANQWFTISGIPIPPLLECWQQTCLRTIALRPL